MVSENGGSFPVLTALCDCDVGAYYYYLTEQNKTYEDSMLAVKTYADSQNIPYRFVKLISPQTIVFRPTRLKQKQHVHTRFVP